jgi:hypothetical protein
MIVETNHKSIFGHLAGIQNAAEFDEALCQIQTKDCRLIDIVERNIYDLDLNDFPLLLDIKYNFVLWAQNDPFISRIDQVFSVILKKDHPSIFEIRKLNGIDYLYLIESHEFSYRSLTLVMKNLSFFSKEHHHADLLKLLIKIDLSDDNDPATQAEIRQFFYETPDPVNFLKTLLNVMQQLRFTLKVSHLLKSLSNILPSARRQVLEELGLILLKVKKENLENYIRLHTYFYEDKPQQSEQKKFFGIDFIKIDKKARSNMIDNLWDLLLHYPQKQKELINFFVRRPDKVIKIVSIVWPVIKEVHVDQLIELLIILNKIPSDQISSYFNALVQTGTLEEWIGELYKFPFSYIELGAYEKSYLMSLAYLNSKNPPCHFRHFFLAYALHSPETRTCIAHLLDKISKEELNVKHVKEAFSSTYFNKTLMPGDFEKSLFVASLFEGVNFLEKDGPMDSKMEKMFYPFGRFIEKDGDENGWGDYPLPLSVFDLIINCGSEKLEIAKPILGTLFPLHRRLFTIFFKFVSCLSLSDLKQRSNQLKTILDKFGKEALRDLNDIIVYFDPNHIPLILNLLEKLAEELPSVYNTKIQTKKIIEVIFKQLPAIREPFYDRVIQSLTGVTDRGEIYFLSRYIVNNDSFLFLSEKHPVVQTANKYKILTEIGSNWPGNQ